MLTDIGDGLLTVVSNARYYYLYGSPEIQGGRYAHI